MGFNSGFKGLNSRFRKLKSEALDHTLWRTRFGRSYGPAVKTTKWMILPLGGAHTEETDWSNKFHETKVHESVNRDIIMKATNKMQLYRLIYYSYSALHVSGKVFAHYREHLTLFTASGSIHSSRCQLVSWMSWNWNCVSNHPWHQPAATWVNATRCCKYSQVLLMMGENIARNM